MEYKNIKKWWMFSVIISCSKKGKKKRVRKGVSFLKSSQLVRTDRVLTIGQTFCEKRNVYYLQKSRINHSIVNSVKGFHMDNMKGYLKNQS